MLFYLPSVAALSDMKVRVQKGIRTQRYEGSSGQGIRRLKPMELTWRESFVYTMHS